MFGDMSKRMDTVQHGGHLVNTGANDTAAQQITVHAHGLQGVQKGKVSIYAMIFV